MAGSIVGMGKGAFILACLVASCSPGKTSSDAGTDEPAPPPGPTQLLIVAADELEASATELMHYRWGRGVVAELRLVSTLSEGCPDAACVSEGIEELVREVHGLYDGEDLFYLLLVGDATESDVVEENPLPAVWSPGAYVDSYSDNPYADLDDDGVPEVAVGRIPASVGEQVQDVLAKIRAYESEASFEPGEWNRRITLAAGNPGYGEPVDGLIESIAYDIIFDIPYHWDLNMTYDRPGSPYYYPEAGFSDKLYERIGDGAFVFAYIGHGSTTDIDVPFDETQVATIDPGGKAPLFFVFACLTGQFTMEGTSFAESLLFEAGAIPAVFASSAVSHPAVNALITQEMKEHLLKARPATIGEALREMKDSLVSRTGDPLREDIEDLLSAVTGEELSGHILDHNYMYNLLGDPMLELRFPGSMLDVSAGGGYTTADVVSVTGSSSLVGEGTAIVTLETSRDTIYPALEDVPAPSDPGYEEIVRGNYETANGMVIERTSVPVTGGSFEAQFEIPDDVPAGTFYVKAYAHDDGADEFAFDDIDVTGP